MARLPVRLLGLFLLTLGIVIPGCQALVQRGGDVDWPSTIGRGVED